MAVIETPEFIAATRKLMSDEERARLVDYLAHNPTEGDLITGTGGVRKLRWALEGAESAAALARSIIFMTLRFRCSR